MSSPAASSVPVQEPAGQPPAINYVLGFLLVGLAWGFTTPFIRKAAKTHNPLPHPLLQSEAVKKSWVKSRAYGAFFAIIDLLRNPRYAVPLLLNLTGSVWFFLLIGKAGTCIPACGRDDHVARHPKVVGGASPGASWGVPELNHTPNHHRKSLMLSRTAYGRPP